MQLFSKRIIFDKRKISNITSHLYTKLSSDCLDRYSNIVRGTVAYVEVWLTWVPCETFLQGKRVQEGWTLFKEEILKMLKQAVPMCQKTRWWRRAPAWVTGELWQRGRRKVSLWSLEAGEGNSGGLRGCGEIMQRVNQKAQSSIRT